MEGGREEERALSGVAWFGFKLGFPVMETRAGEA